MEMKNLKWKKDQLDTSKLKKTGSQKWLKEVNQEKILTLKSNY